MITSISNAVLWIIARIRDFLMAFFHPSGQLKLLLPAIGIAVGVALVFLAVKIIRNIIKGY